MVAAADVSEKLVTLIEKLSVRIDQLERQTFSANWPKGAKSRKGSKIVYWQMLEVWKDWSQEEGKSMAQSLTISPVTCTDGYRVIGSIYGVPVSFLLDIYPGGSHYSSGGQVEGYHHWRREDTKIAVGSHYSSGGQVEGYQHWRREDTKIAVNAALGWSGQITAGHSWTCGG